VRFVVAFPPSTSIEIRIVDTAFLGVPRIRPPDGPLFLRVVRSFCGKSAVATGGIEPVVKLCVLTNASPMQSGFSAGTERGNFGEQSNANLCRWAAVQCEF
jgi:hypothetical protein